ECIFFFFQAEDGIRDRNVTGVQTCALPILSSGALSGTSGKSLRLEAIQIRLTGGVASKYRLRYRVHVQNEGWQSWKYDSETAGRSEERRVGKECRNST